MKLSRLLTFSLLAFILTVSSLTAKTIHVDAGNAASGRPVSPYSDWGSATTSLQDALDLATAGDQIWVAAGTYYPDDGQGLANNDRNLSFQLKAGVAIYGGFLGTEGELADKNPAANLTLLSGDIDQDGAPDNNSYHVLTAAGVDATAILNGFTIIRGNADGDVDINASLGLGGGLLSFQASPTIENCSFVGNKGVFGGAVYCEDGAPTFTNCSFQANESSAGGAFFSQFASPALINCLFQGNKATAYGGAVYVFNSSATLANCSFQGNQAFEFGGAIVNDASETSMSNCILWNNQADGATDTANASIHNAENSFLTFSHCLVENFSKADLDSFDESPDTNLEPDDPRFIALANPANAPSLIGDLRLLSGSPAIDAGQETDITPTTDLAGAPRRANETVDLGPYEFNPQVAILSWTPINADQLDAPSVSATLALSSGISTFPEAWKDAFQISTRGTVNYTGLSISGSGYTLVLTVSGLSGEGTLFLVSNSVAADAQGLALTSQSAITLHRFSTATPRHYVNAANASPAVPYDTWATAATDLQDALYYAAAGDQVWVAKGTYYPDEGFAQTNNDRAATFQLKQGVGLYGGFSGTETNLAEASPPDHPTILSGDIDQDGDPISNLIFNQNSYSVLTAIGVDASSVLQGFTITAGNADNVVSSSLFHSHNFGGALYCEQASPTVVNCSFIGNKALNGGAVGVLNASPTLDNCRFLGNEAKGLVGDFRGNGGAIYLSNSSPVLRNCSFQKNQASRGGAIYNSTKSSPTLVNCSLQGNIGIGTFSGVIHNASSSPKLRNCIIWGNLGPSIVNSEIFGEGGSPIEISTPVFSHCLIQGFSKAILDASGTSPDTNFEPADPLFAVQSAPSAAGDLRLLNGSPALDAGSNAYNTTPTDSAGSPRILNGTIDLGAFEGSNAVVVSWTQIDPEQLDATSLSANLVLNNPVGPFPDAWKDAFQIAKNGSINYTALTIAGTGPSYNITLTGLSGEGTLSLVSNSVAADAQGLALIGQSATTLQRRSASTPRHYVNASNASPAAPYDTWATAATDLQNALFFAAPGDQVWVAKGTYYPDQGHGQTDNDRSATFPIKQGVVLLGGFAGDETNLKHANPPHNLTILSGDIDQDGDLAQNSYSVLTAINVDGTSVLKGFTITGGNADHSDSNNLPGSHGGALFCNNASPTLADCSFEGNQAGDGGAIYCALGAPLLTDCSFKGNQASQFRGGAIFFHASSPDIRNCLFQGNYAAGYGGALSFSSTRTPVSNGCNDRFQTSITNCSFQGNSSSGMGGAVSNDGSTLSFTNCSFQGNWASNEGGAIANTNRAMSRFKNCIIWDNQAEGVSSSTSASIFNDFELSFFREVFTPLFSHCIVENWSKAILDASGKSTFGENTGLDACGNNTATNFDPVDPLFLLMANPANVLSHGGNLRLRPGSPAIEAGDNNANTHPTDLSGNPRVAFETIDLGAYEYRLGLAPPVVVLRGKSTMTVPFGATWSDPGATATDVLGTPLTVTIGGDTVDTTQTQGTFILTYYATDDFGNVAFQVTREVIIVGVISFDPKANNQLSWTAGWILQTSTDLQLWTDLPNAQSPLALSSITDAQRFWRLRKAG